MLHLDRLLRVHPATRFPYPYGVATLGRALSIGALALVAVWMTGCAHDVIPLDSAPVTPMIPPERPLGLTPGLEVQSFEAKRLVEQPFVDRFARGLRDAQLFVGVIHPVPADFEPMWELKLLVRDELEDPDSNFWKAFFASAFLPLRLFLYQQEDYTLYVEALLTRKDEVIGTYRSEASVRHRFQAYDLRQELAAAELLVDRTTAEVLAALSRDLARINREDIARAGR